MTINASGTDLYREDELIALSGLQHIAYCERQWALIHVEGLWTDNMDTIRGDLFHRRVDAPGYTCSKSIRSERSVPVVSYSVGLYGVADIVEYANTKDGLIVKPVEYKSGKPKTEDWDRVQLAGQAMCLEEMYNTDINEADIFYGMTRRRETVGITDSLRQRVCELAQKAHALLSAGITPLGYLSSRCRRCSLADDCLPGIGCKSVSEYWETFGN